MKYKAGENTHIGKDQTIHASKEGVVLFQKNPWLTQKRWRVHVVQQENPNRSIPTPPPFVYHPELYPELAKNNPEPSNYEIKKKIVKF